MYNETYDNYIRSILGYPTRNQFEQYNYEPQEYQEYRNPTHPFPDARSPA